jgi:hypothetical protein
MAKRIFIFIFLFFISNVYTFAQCAMCTKTAQGLDRKAQEGINNAIIYLAVIPFGMLLSVFYYMYRSSKKID